jgi:hypothetical protein
MIVTMANQSPFLALLRMTFSDVILITGYLRRSALSSAFESRLVPCL